MSVFFGEIRQLGYVVPDIEAAMDHWSRVLGVGPFFYAPRVPVEKFTYKGEPSSPITSVALANSGPVQVELIQQRRAERAQVDTVARDGDLAGLGASERQQLIDDALELVDLL